MLTETEAVNFLKFWNISNKNSSVEREKVFRKKFMKKNWNILGNRYIF